MTTPSPKERTDKVKPWFVRAATPDGFAAFIALAKTELGARRQVLKRRPKPRIIEIGELKYPHAWKIDFRG